MLWGCASRSVGRLQAKMRRRAEPWQSASITPRETITVFQNIQRGFRAANLALLQSTQRITGPYISTQAILMMRGGLSAPLLRNAWAALHKLNATLPRPHDTSAGLSNMTREQKTPDFYWTFDGFFFRLIPQNDQADTAWRQIEAVFERGAIPCTVWASTRAQLRKAGYTVHKTKPARKGELEAILAELGI